MYQRKFPFVALVLVTMLTGCAGLKETMQPLQETLSWNPLAKDTSTDELTPDDKPSKTGFFNKDKSEAEEFENPVTMAVLWTPSNFERPGIRSIRGFSGRVYFYDQDQKAIKADGELIVFGFDNTTKTDESGIARKKKFVYRQSEFQSHFSESGLGASYNVWVPWEEFGGYRKSITLIPMFRLDDGTLLKADTLINNLDGFEPEEEVTNADSPVPFKVLGGSKAVGFKGGLNKRQPKAGLASNAVSLVSNDDQHERNLRVRSSTIRVPKGLATQMKNATSRQGFQGPIETRNSGVPIVANREMNPIVATDNGATQSESAPAKVARSPEVQADTEILPVKSKRRAYGAPGQFN